VEGLAGTQGHKREEGGLTTDTDTADENRRFCWAVVFVLFVFFVVEMRPTMQRTRRFFTTAVLLAVGLLGLGPPAQGASIYFSIPGITGENPTPGYPGAMLVNSLDIVSDGFSFMKAVDKATPQINTAVIKGTPLGTVNALFYNSAPSGAPDAILPFANVLASSQSISVSLVETDKFVATTPASMFLEVSGITGEASTPGYTGLMQLDSLELSGNTLTVTRPTDKATPQIQTAVALGTLHSAKLLFYNSTPTGPPDAEIDFSEVLASSYSPLSSGTLPEEVDSFVFSSLSEPTPTTGATPEPATALLALAGVGLGGAGLVRRRKH
jgi:LPXTG-motif cell wall-anchored protein